MEDPFIYGPDGFPVSVKHVEHPSLTREELRDLIVAATVRTQPEALALIDWLQDAHIPALHRPGHLAPLGAAVAVDILVPRKRAREAASSIAAFREQTARHKTRLRMHAEQRGQLKPKHSEIGDDSQASHSAPLPQTIAKIPSTEEALPEWASVPVEKPPSKPTAFQLAQRGAGAALLAIGGSLLALELMMNGLKTPLSLVALCLTVLGLSLTLKSLPK